MTPSTLASTCVRNQETHLPSLYNPDPLQPNFIWSQLHFGSLFYEDQIVFREYRKETLAWAVPAKICLNEVLLQLMCVSHSPQSSIPSQFLLASMNTAYLYNYKKLMIEAISSSI